MGEDVPVGIDQFNPSATADALWDGLAATNDPAMPHTVARFGRLCRFGVDDASGRLELREHDVDTMRDQLTRKLWPVKGTFSSGTWVLDTDDDGKYRRARLPNEAVQALIKRPLDKLDEVAPVPRVDRIVDVPVFDRAGAVVTGRGYHPGARLYYDDDAMQGITEWADPDERATDVQVARHVLLDELLGDFPFADQASRAHAVAMAIEQFARDLVDGPTPAYVVIAAEQGTGKSLLAQACLLPACGRLDLTPEPEPTPQDFQKRLLSELIRGPQAIVFDNVTRELENSTLSTMLASGKYADRVLGKSQILSFPIRHTTVFTMNNPEIGPDMRRRVVPIYLDAMTEHPWTRTGPAPGRAWRHPNLLAWAQANRGRLVHAAVTIVKNYQDGWTDVGHGGEEYTRRVATPRMMGTFEAWSQVVGGAVTAAGVQGFGANLDRLYGEQSDADSDEAAFLAEWPDGRRMTAAQVTQWVTVGLADVGLGVPGDPPPALRDRRTGRVDAASVGYGLRRLHGKVRGGRRLENDRAARPTEWYVTRV